MEAAEAAEALFACRDPARKCGWRCRPAWRKEEEEESFDAGVRCGRRPVGEAESGRRSGRRSERRKRNTKMIVDGAEGEEETKIGYVGADDEGKRIVDVDAETAISRPSCRSAFSGRKTTMTSKRRRKRIWIASTSTAALPPTAPSLRPFYYGSRLERPSDR